MVWEEMSFEEFQNGHQGGHLICQKGTNLEILNFHVSLKPPTKFQLNPTYHSGEMFFQDFQDGHLGYWNWNRTNLAILNKSPLSWTAEQKDFRKSESLCHCDVAFLDIGMEQF